MFYYHVWVRSERYRSDEPLTYSAIDKLSTGSLVRVPLRQQTVPGVVVGPAPKPKFTTKPVEHAFALPPLPASTIRLMEWLQMYYPSPVGVITQLFLPPVIHDLPLEPSESIQNPASVALQPLTTQQQTALAQINKAETYVLHGRTGSGKTRIYIELALRAIAQGTSALILCPEIGLTPQLYVSFEKTFGDRVIVLHSQLTAKQRETAWRAILTAAEPVVVLGPRSALFSPILSLGLIVVDESHDGAYKQEQPPYYQTVRVASQLRAIHGASLVLGSATPSVTDYYLAQQFGKPILRLDQLATPQTYERHVNVVDLKDRSQFSRVPHISLPLVEALRGSLERGEQSLLYLNRRGTARVVLCTNCGWQAKCPNCDLPLTYHGDSFTIKCHICSYTAKPPISCPVCGNPDLTFRSFGTKAIVEEVQRLFPEAHILRLDTDNTKAERLEQQYERIYRGDVDILVGTQLLTKGLDLPRLSTLGVVLADSSLYVPDYTAQERTYQLLTQVIGRIGRGHIAASLVIQTYHPDSPLIQAALDDNWPEFYKSEIKERELYRYPPFSYLLKLTCKRASAKSAEAAATRFKSQLEMLTLKIAVDGPAPAFHEKSGRNYSWQLVVKARDRKALLRVIPELPAGWSYDLDPADLL